VSTTDLGAILSKRPSIILALSDRARRRGYLRRVSAAHRSRCGRWPTVAATAVLRREVRGQRSSVPGSAGGYRLGVSRVWGSNCNGGCRGDREPLRARLSEAAHPAPGAKAATPMTSRSWAIT